MKFQNLYIFYSSIFMSVLLFYFLKKNRISKIHSPLYPLVKKTNLIFLQKNSILFCITTFLFLLCLSRPQKEYSVVQTNLKGTETIFILDISRSMLVEDILPNRLEIAKQALLDLSMVLEPGDQAGLLVFSGKFVILCPITTDHKTFRKQIQNANAKIIQQQGTILCESIKVAYKLFSKRQNTKTIVIATDGEIHEEKIFTNLEKILLPEIKIHTIVVGTLNGGKVPVSENYQKQIQFLKNKSGETVISKPNYDLCKKISDTTLASIAIVSNNTPNLKNIREDLLSSKKKEPTPIIMLLSQELYQPVAIVLWMLLFGQCFLSKRFGGLVDVT